MVETTHHPACLGQESFCFRSPAPQKKIVLLAKIVFLGVAFSASHLAVFVVLVTQQGVAVRPKSPNAYIGLRAPSC
jgi:hypothetical protein